MWSLTKYGTNALFGLVISESHYSFQLTHINSFVFGSTVLSVSCLVWPRPLQVLCTSSRGPLQAPLERTDTPRRGPSSSPWLPQPQRYSRWSRRREEGEMRYVYVYIRSVWIWYVVCMYVCMHVYVYVHVHACVYVCTHDVVMIF